MHTFQNKTIREIAIETPLTIRVFENHKIDFCCGGRVPLTEACRNAGADPFVVLAELEKALSGEGAETGRQMETKTPAELIDHIVCTHHAFTRSEIERLLPLADKVASRHGEHHPELLEMPDIVHELGSELLVHMQKEERMLFPHIEKLHGAAAAKEAPISAPFGTVNNPVRMMMFEHDQAGEMLRRLRELSSDYSIPDGACPSYIGLLAGLEYLEKDLHLHIHLENNILFPQAIELERQALSNSATAVY